MLDGLVSSHPPTCGRGRERRRVSESHDGRGFESLLVVIFIVVVVVLIGVVVVVVVIGVGKVVVVVQLCEKRSGAARFQKLFQRDLRLKKRQVVF